jgi:germination protein M
MIGPQRSNSRHRRHMHLASIISATLAALLAAGALAACAGVGSLGPVPTVVPPSAAGGGDAMPEPTPPPDAYAPTPPAAAGPSGPVPTTVPAATPTLEPSALESTPPPATPQTPVPSPTVAPTAEGTTTVRVYFLAPSRGGGDPHLVPVLRSVPATRAVATAAVTALLAGPAADERGLVTTIPDGTRLLGVTIDGSAATVDLSSAFDSGGGTFSMTGRLAQLVYTVTQFPTVDTVLLRMDGQPVTVLGGEGILVEGGLRRAAYRDFLPAIFVDRPAWRGALPSGARVTGIANVFEARFGVRLVDGGGRILVDKPVMATCGTGCWGTFDVGVDYSVSKAQWGTLRVYNRSPKDGSLVVVADYPVWLMP